MKLIFPGERLDGISHCWALTMREISLHVFSDERTLGAQPWRTEGLCPWWALITLAWRPTSDQIKMLQAHHEQGNLCSAAAWCRGSSPAVCLPLLISLSPTQLLFTWHSPSSSDSPTLSGCFKKHCRDLDCFNYPHVLLSFLHQSIPASVIFHFLSYNSVSSSDSSDCLPTASFLTLPGCVLTQTWAPFPPSLHFPHFPCCVPCC